MLLGKSNSFGTLKILIIAIGLFSVTGCKKPESNFRLNKYEYAAGEMLLLENLSINAKETTWEIISPENEIIETSKQGLIPVLIRTGVFYGTGIENINITQHSTIDELNMPLVIFYPGEINGDHHHYLNAKQSSNYRCTII